LCAGSRTVGYVLVPTFWDETIAERTREVLIDLLAPEDGTSEPVSGLIIDMRINGGGIYTELVDLLSLFVSGEVGGFRRRGGSWDPLVIDPDPIGESQNLPVVVLVGETTESYAEVFSGVMQELGRAKLVGQPTSGNLETVYAYDLEDGSRLWLAEEVFEPLSGTRWEGHGVIPNRLVPGSWGDFTERDDPQVRAALDLMLISAAD
jgi:C-terminal processing protease CtpA/Prc